MKKEYDFKQKKGWISGCVIFVLVMIALIINFARIGIRDAEQKVEDILIDTVQAFSAKTFEELNDMRQMGAPLSGIMGSLDSSENHLAVVCLDELVKNSSAYMSVACNSDGTGITDAGKLVDVSKEPYFVVEEDEKQTYYYIEKEGITGKEAIVCSVPIATDNLEVGMLYSYYDLERIYEKYTSDGIYASSFLIFSIEDGEIVLKIDEKGIVSGNNIYEDIENIDSGPEAKIMKQKMRLSESGMSEFVKDETVQHMIYTPLNINNWYFTIGIGQEYIDIRVNAEWEESRNMLILLVAVLLTFIVSIFFFVILLRIKNAKKHELLEEKAERDLLSGLYNKIATEKKIKEYIAKNPTAQGALFLIDIDNFKNINDTKGHFFGDEVLKEIGFRMRSLLRPEDIVGRVGGDEFMVFVKNISDLDGIEREMERVSQLFTNFKAGEFSKYRVTASVGGAVYGKDGKDFERLYKCVDQAVYQAKRRGKNCLVMYQKN